MPEVETQFSPEQFATESFRLLELLPDLCKVIKSPDDIDVPGFPSWSSNGVSLSALRPLISTSRPSGKTQVSSED